MPRIFEVTLTTQIQVMMEAEDADEARECMRVRCCREIGQLGEASRIYALEVFREYRTALETADRADLEALAILLIQKRAVDGLNGRRWNAGAHLYFEDAVTSILAKVKSPNESSSATRPAETHK